MNDESGMTKATAALLESLGYPPVHAQELAEAFDRSPILTEDWRTCPCTGCSADRASAANNHRDGGREARWADSSRQFAAYPAGRVLHERPGCCVRDTGQDVSESMNWPVAMNRQEAIDWLAHRDWPARRRCLICSPEIPDPAPFPKVLKCEGPRCEGFNAKSQCQLLPGHNGPHATGARDGVTFWGELARPLREAMPWADSFPREPRA